MSRIGKKPIPVPSGVKVDLSGSRVKMSGAKGELEWDLPAPITAKFDSAAGMIQVDRPDDRKTSRALHGLSRALLANMVQGVHEGYSRSLEIYGTGYGCKLVGKQLHVNAGFMGRGLNRPAQFVIDVPAGVDVKVQAETARGDMSPAKFTISGPDKQKVGQFAAEIRKLRPPEPYKGKGIRYADEVVRRKPGKAFASGTR